MSKIGHLFLSVFQSGWWLGLFLFPQVREAWERFWQRLLSLPKELAQKLRNASLDREIRQRLNQ